jgi:hypothetical protein
MTYDTHDRLIGKKGGKVGKVGDMGDYRLREGRWWAGEMLYYLRISSLQIFEKTHSFGANLVQTS